MANSPIRSANKAYYASKQPLLFRATKEGRKNPQPNPSYRQKANDTAASSNKYYAELGVEPGVPGQPLVQQPKAVPMNTAGPTAKVQAHPQVLQDVVREFQNGASNVQVAGSSEQINKARAAVDLAVGRNTLTRAQADRVSFISIMGSAADTPKEVVSETRQSMEADANTSDTVLEKAATPTVPETTREAEPDSETSGVPEVDAILHPPEEKPKPKRKRRTKKKQEQSDEITESDLASAFGVTDAEDDFDSDD